MNLAGIPANALIKHNAEERNATQIFELAGLALVLAASGWTVSSRPCCRRSHMQKLFVSSTEIEVKAFKTACLN